MPVGEFARGVVRKLGNGVRRIRIGQAKGLHFMSRFFPSFIYNKLNDIKEDSKVG